MPVETRDEGRYELFETTHGHRILVLNGERWFAWIEGDEGEILVHSDSDHEKDRTIREGEFFVVDFEEDPKYKDMPHLFLQDGEEFREYMIPNGLPTEGDYQKKVVTTDERLPREKLKEYLEHPAPAGEGESRMDRPGGGSMANVAHHLKGIDFPASREEVIEHARSHDAPEAVIDQLEGIGSQREFGDMAEVMEAIGEGEETREGSGSELPIEGYDELTVDEAAERLDGLSEAELKRVRAYEREHKDRSTLLEEIDRRLDR
jgi:hypothetical protein